VSSERRENGFEAVAVIEPCEVGEVAGAGVFAALIGRNGEYAASGAEFGERFSEKLA
jgi:hypothetical protein